MRGGSLYPPLFITGMVNACVQEHDAGSIIPLMRVDSLVNAWGLHCLSQLRIILSCLIVVRETILIMPAVIRICILCLLIVSLPFTAESGTFVQPGPVVENIETISGQSLGVTRGLIAGQSGFIWVATDQGLVRYDGYNIKRYTHDDNDPHSIPGNHIRAMVQDPDGYIWLATNKRGLSRFSIATEQFKNFRSVADQPSTLDSDELNSISLGADNQLWIGTERGVNLFDRKTLTNRRLNADLSLPAETTVRVLVPDQLQRLWIVNTNNGLSLHHLNSGKTTHFRHDPTDLKSTNLGRIDRVYASPDGQIWTGGNAGLARYDPHQQKFELIASNYKKSNKHQDIIVKSLYQDGAGDLWIGSFFNGVSVLKAGADSATVINPSMALKDTINMVNITGITQDVNGTLWFSTFSHGLIRLAPGALSFKHYMVAIDDPQILSSAFSDVNGDLWLGSNQNLYVFNQQTQVFDMVVNDIGNIISIHQGEGQSLVLGIRYKGLLTFDLTSRQVQPNTGASLSEINLGRLAIDDQGTRWIGVNASGQEAPGLFSLDRKNQRYVQHLTDTSVFSLLPVSDKTGRYILIGTKGNGLKILDVDSGSVSDIMLADHKLGFVLSLFKDRQQRIWVGTKNAGLLQLDLTSRTLTPRLPELIVKNIIQDLSEVLWLGSPDGVFKYQPDIQPSKQLIKVNTRQGLRISKIGSQTSTVTATGQLVLVNSNGLAFFSPEAVTAIDLPPTVDTPITLSDFRLFDHAVKTRANDPASPLVTILNDLDVITVSAQQYRFAFGFASSFSHAPNRIRYAFRVSDYDSSDYDPAKNDKQWVERNANNRLVSFTSPQAGDHLFEVKASYPNGDWNENNIRRLKITVKPPFWASTPAYILYVLALILLGFMFNFVRIRQLQQRAKTLEQGIEERTVELQQRTETVTALLKDKDRLFANISHEFRTPLTLILGPLDADLKNARDDQHRDDKSLKLIRLARSNAQRLLSMVDQLLDISRLQDFQPRASEPKNIQATCQFLLDSYRSLAEEKDIKLVLDSHIQADVTVDMLPDSLEKILSNLLTNAFKYSAGHQLITLKMALNQQRQVVISVSDTGMGIGEADQQNIFERFTRVENTTDYVPGAGIGLALVKELVEQHKGAISVQSELGVGSTFTVVLPLSATSNSAERGAPNKALLLSSVEQMKQDALPEEAAEPQNLEPSIEADSQRATVLVIEDNYEMRQYISSCLSDSFDCILAVDGEQGIKLARETLPDLIISDVMMPKKDGFAVTKTLKADLTTNHIPIILLTAHGDSKSRLKGWTEKADEYLEKPFNTTELLTRIENLLAIRGLLRQRYQREFAAGVMTVDHAAVDHQSVDSSEAQAAVVDILHQAFFDKVNQVLAANYADENFNIGEFASQMALSSRQLSRKMKALLDLSPVESIRSYRLKKAAELLTDGVSPSVVAHQVGFTSHSYFSQCFKAQYQCMPSGYAAA